jgi:hypothetical protein
MRDVYSACHFSLGFFAGFVAFFLPFLFTIVLDGPARFIITVAVLAVIPSCNFPLYAGFCSLGIGSGQEEIRKANLTYHGFIRPGDDTPISRQQEPLLPLIHPRL